MCAITPEESLRICKHMNNDHAHTIYAMAKKSSSSFVVGSKITNAKLNSISNHSYDISFVVCHGDLCEMKQETVEFVPPLKDVKEARPRMIEEHNRVLTPSLTYLLTPLNISIIVICVLLGYATHILTPDKLTSLLLNDSSSSSSSFYNAYIILPIFGSIEMFVNWVVGGWYFALVAHLMEAIYFGVLCRTKLKIRWFGTMKWCFMVFLVGFAVGWRILEFVGVLNEMKKKKEKEKEEKDG